MRRAAQGDFRGARQDLLSAHRLLRAVAGSTHRSISICEEYELFSAEQELAARGRFTPPQLAQLAADLASLPPVRAIADTVDTLHRYWMLDLIAALSTSKRIEDRIASAIDVATGDPPGIDWNQVARQVNAIIDDTVAAARLPEYRHSVRAVGVLADRLWHRRKQLTGKKSIKKFAIDPSGELRRVDKPTPLGVFARDPAVFLTWETVGTIGSDLLLEQRLAANVALTRVALALAVHKARHGTYPQRLSLLGSLPTDPYTGGPLGYKTTQTGYVLWAAGEDLSDDGADPDSDDVSVRPEPFVPHHRRPESQDTE